ncbi:Hypothetical_protein [Hexamita inflata]|uniref:Hypothetical_protein n=1 Tax=Hexamita inflata TaxID=28002 RepID=A0AA86U9M9_9EUKA|nr:Hypothetical protein HINF_LOCUS30422 [Hexamita inflata]
MSTSSHAIHSLRTQCTVGDSGNTIALCISYTQPESGKAIFLPHQVTFFNRKATITFRISRAGFTQRDDIWTQNVRIRHVTDSVYRSLLNQADVNVHQFRANSEKRRVAYSMLTQSQ